MFSLDPLSVFIHAVNVECRRGISLLLFMAITRDLIEFISLEREIFLDKINQIIFIEGV